MRNFGLHRHNDRVPSRDWTLIDWRDRTKWERTQGVLAMFVATVVGLAMFMGALLVIGEMLDGVSRYKSEHDRCLQKATNGYEIERCR